MSAQSAPVFNSARLIEPRLAKQGAWPSEAPATYPPSAIGFDKTPVRQRVKIGQDLFCKGDPADYFYRGVAGIIRTCRFFDDGRRQIDAFYVAGDIFGFEPGGDYRYSAEAVTDGVVERYRRSDVERLISDNVMVSRYFFGIALRDVGRAQDHSLLLGRKTANERVATFLKEWLMSSSTEHTIMLAMTRQDIADYLGLTIETVSRTLTQMERDGIIEIVSPRKISVRDRSTLKRLSSL